MESKTNSTLKLAYKAIEKLQSRVEELEQGADQIAIIGAGCKFPGNINSLDDYWQALMAGKSVVEQDIEGSLETIHETLKGQSHAKLHGGLISDVDLFDAAFFNISKREAESMDPQQRLVLETAYQALEQSGYAGETKNTAAIGVFIGSAANEYADLCYQYGDIADSAYWATGNAVNTIAGRVAYCLGLHGPAMTFDTACSSAATAIYQAMRTLQNHEVDVALAGGVNLMLTTDTFVPLQKAQMLSPSGLCQAFDNRADGYVRSEGCGIIALKRLRDAIRDQDTILAVIKGGAMNHDGHSSSLTAPNGNSQQQVIKQALKNAKVTPQALHYVEAHGTGTPLGDPIEMHALKAVYTPARDADNPLYVGSVKANLGHTEAASGVASVIKAALIAANKQLPPQVHYDTLNQFIEIDEQQIQVTKQTVDLSEQTQIHTAVSAFGFSGTNVHLILASHTPSEQSNTEINNDALLLPISAKSEQQLAILAQRYLSLLERSDNLEQVVANAAMRRAHYPYRLAVTGANKQALCDALQAQIAKPLAASKLPVKGEQIAFMFTGQGSQYKGMGQALYGINRVFKSTVDECEAFIEKAAGFSIKAVMWGADSKRLSQTEFTQPSLFVLEYALAKMWQSWGVQPSIVMGHSIGEYAAACIAGVFSLQDALKMVLARGRLMQKLPSDGAMLAVVANGNVVKELMADLPAEKIAVASYNSVRQTVLSGDKSLIKVVAERGEEKGITCVMLDVSHAFHSPLMRPMLAEFRVIAQQVNYSTPKLDFISTCTGKQEYQKLTDPEYWVQHAELPVNFVEGLRTLAANKKVDVIEVGPHPVLTKLALQSTFDFVHYQWLCSQDKEQPQATCITNTLATLYRTGHDINWQSVFNHQVVAATAIPSYPFTRESFWLGEKRVHARHASVQDPFFVDVQKGSHSSSFKTQCNVQSQPLLKDHLVYDEVVVPGGYHVSLVLNALANHSTESQLVLENVFFGAPILLADGNESTQLTTTLNHADFAVNSTQSEQGALTHAHGRYFTSSESVSNAAIDPNALVTAATKQWEMPEFYERIEQMTKIAHGDTFRWVESCWFGDGYIIAKLNTPKAIIAPERYCMHPGLVDSCFQVFGALAVNQMGDNKEITAVPFGFNKLHTHSEQLSAPQTLWCFAKLDDDIAEDKAILKGDIALFSDSGEPVATIDSFSVHKTNASTFLSKSEEGSFLFQREWIESTQAQSDDTAYTEQDLARLWLILDDDQDIISHQTFASHTLGECQVFKHANKDKGVVAGVRRLNLLDQHELSEALTQLTTKPDQIIFALKNAEQGVCVTNYYDSVNSIITLVKNLIGQELYSRLLFVNYGTSDVALLGAPKPHWGIAEVVRTEHPEFSCQTLDLNAENLSDLVAGVIEHSRYQDNEPRVQLDNGMRKVMRLTKTRPTSELDKYTVAGEKTTLITGGLGGLGLQLSQWLVGKGAKHLTLLSRRTTWSDEVEHTLQAIRAQQVGVEVVAVDIADQSSMEQLFQRFGDDLPSLGSVIHAAGVVQDSPLHKFDMGSVTQVSRSKVEGTWNLHQLTKDIDLDHFYCFSSASAVLGTPGQAIYAAANSFIDYIVEHRKHSGLPALAVQWGPWGSVGMAAESHSQSDLFEAVGMKPFTLNQGMALFEQIARSELHSVVALKADWRVFRENFPGAQHDHLYDELAPTSSRAGQIRFIEEICDMSPELRYEKIFEFVRETLAKVLKIDSPATIDPEKGFFEMGTDSIAAMDLKKDIDAELGISLPSTVIFNYSNLNLLVDHIVNDVLQLDTGVAEVEYSSEIAIESPTDELQDMELDDLAALLEQELELN
ncbi:SDR family NAD(P)-dependent oxidoreductase [Pseudoalteromonas sp. J010]|uniref:type I polyketide synthase n=1 Tax=Pseudoalteromonas sp. J010 TaxID=998465 RepID=UPI000F6560F9|nr:type I polyketide synthase [Pseudoalteromonas sp. J010]RRS10215.1 SDR family NAD(P)-dependent oxidoreductase [Pseudoalteromonas sp. J010]